MTRIPYVRREELGPEGQQLWDGIVNGREDLVVTPEGGLAGPFNAFVTVPGAGRRLSSLGAKLRFGTCGTKHICGARHTAYNAASACSAQHLHLVGTAVQFDLSR